MHLGVWPSIVGMQLMSEQTFSIRCVFKVIGNYYDVIFTVKGSKIELFIALYLISFHLIKKKNFSSAAPGPSLQALPRDYDLRNFFSFISFHEFHEVKRNE